MDEATYAVESQIEQTHWWFVVRRKLFRKAIESMRLPPDAAILDIGTSTGSNLRMLREMAFTNFQGLDLSDDAIRWCAEKGLGVVRKGDVCSLPFADAQFDLVLATDIVEHVEYDVQALQEICRVLKPSGRAIITVPAFESLWGFQDSVSHHKRRYTRRELLDKIKASGCRTYQSYYFNFLLFVPIWIARQLIRIFKPKLESENQVNSPLINAVLKAIFSVDVACAGTLHVPFGVSIFALVGKNGA
jgi:ubiquinone/menaquinone biosynthesis C-methylase UbiE